MQSIEFKRFPIHLLAIAIAVLAAVMIVMAATGIIFDDSDTDSTTRSGVVRTSSASSAKPDLSVERMRFLEMNTNLPEAGPGSVGNAPAPVIDRPAVASVERMQFLEMNLNLPGTAAPKVIPHEVTRFLEMNELPGDGAVELPFPISSGGGSLTDY
jgi:hypothetical protein